MAAVTEVLGVLVVGNLVAKLLMALLDVADPGDLQREMLAGVEARDFLLLSRVTLVQLLLKWGCLLGLAFAVGWWRRRHGPRHYGLTLSGDSTFRLLVMGVAAAALGGLLPEALTFSSRYLPIGEGPDHWALFPDRLSWPFLLYMAIASFGLVPIVEELFVRGYMQTRLTEEFGPAGGISLVAILFALAHSQYFKAEVLSIGMLVSIVVGSLVVGWVFHRTGSLLPCVLAHAALNFPLRGAAQGAAIAVMAVIALLSLRAAVREARAFGRAALATPDRSGLWVALGVFGGGVLLLAVAPLAGLTAGAASLVVALGLALRQKRRPAAS